MDNTTTPSSDSGYDLLKEDCIPFSQTARKLPKVRGKKHPSPSTIWRWARHGCRNRKTGELIRLEYIKIGGTNCTSMEALARFFARLRDDDPPDTSCIPVNPDPPNKPGTSKHNSPEKRAEEATEILRRRGIVK